jgi:histidinol dehydrogenase
MVETALADAQEQTTELRRQTMREIRSVMNHVQEMGAAATEELETQRILTNVAQLKVSASQVEDESDAVDDDWISSLGLAGEQSEDASADEPETESAPVESESDPVVENNSNTNQANHTKSDKSDKP